MGWQKAKGGCFRNLVFPPDALTVTKQQSLEALFVFRFPRIQTRPQRKYAPPTPAGFAPVCRLATSTCAERGSGRWRSRARVVFACLGLGIDILQFFGLVRCRVICMVVLHRRWKLMRLHVCFNCSLPLSLCLRLCLSLSGYLSPLTSLPLPPLTEANP